MTIEHDAFAKLLAHVDSIIRDGCESLGAAAGPPMRRPIAEDPRCADFDAFLTLLAPRDELLYRLALRGLSDHCATDWRRQERIRERFGMRRAIDEPVALGGLDA